MATTVRQIDAMRKASSDKSARRRAALRGAGRLMDIGGTLSVIRRRASMPATVEDALAGDWMRVGEALRSALNIWQESDASRQS